MSPRSTELLEAARRRLKAAAAAVDEDPSGAISLAYYAMLYAARAGLSEQDVQPRTHRGTWHEFRRLYVATGAFDASLAAAAQSTQPEREHADYDAWAAPAEDARRIMVIAAQFFEAVTDASRRNPHPMTSRHLRWAGRLITGPLGLCTMRYVRGRFLAGAALTAVMAGLGALPTNAAAQEPGVTVDPGSPAGKEYALPIDTARREGQGDGGAKSRGASPGTTPPFGQGITPAPGRASNGSISDSGATKASRDTATSGNDDGAGGNGSAGGGGSGGGDSGSGPPGSTADVPAASASAGSTGPTALTAGTILAVLTAGGLGGFLVRRRRTDA